MGCGASLADDDESARNTTDGFNPARRDRSTVVRRHHSHYWSLVRRSRPRDLRGARRAGRADLVARPAEVSAHLRRARVSTSRPGHLAGVLLVLASLHRRRTGSRTTGPGNRRTDRTCGCGVDETKELLPALARAGSASTVGLLAGVAVIFVSEYRIPFEIGHLTSASTYNGDIAQYVAVAGSLVSHGFSRAGNIAGASLGAIATNAAGSGPGAVRCARRRRRGNRPRTLAGRVTAPPRSRRAGSTRGS